MMKEKITFLGIDIMKELDVLLKDEEKQIGYPMSGEMLIGFNHAKELLDILLNRFIEDEETFVLNVPNLEKMEEFDYDDLYDYAKENDFQLFIFNDDIKVGDSIIIRSNLINEYKKLGTYTSQNIKDLIGTEQEVLAVYKDNNSKQKYVTIDLCVEIPIQCVAKLAD